jgi:hypothetical protein
MGVLPASVPPHLATCGFLQKGTGAKYLEEQCNQIRFISVYLTKRMKDDRKGLTMLISTLALAMSIAMMVSAIVILYNETVARKHQSSFE